MIITRRNLFGILAAPAIIRVADLMPVKALAGPTNLNFIPTAELIVPVLPPGVYPMMMESFEMVDGRMIATMRIKDMLIKQVLTTIRKPYGEILNG